MNPKKSKPRTTADDEIFLAEAIDLYEPQELVAAFASLQLKSNERKKMLASAVTLPNSSIKQEGRKSKLNQGKLVSRGLRSFKSERERQLLKQVSTQCFFALDQFLRKQPSNHLKLIEVEMMHIIYGKKHFVFIAANESTVSKHFKDIIGTSKEAVNQMLTTEYTPHRDYEGKRRSASYAKKLKARLFGDNLCIPGSLDPNDDKNAKALGKALTEAPWEVLDINANLEKKIRTLSEDKNSGVFALDNHSLLYKERHAEEYLVDIAEIFKQLAKEKNLKLRTSVGGKKRPCISCSGRMQGVIDSFGKRPGLLWLHAVGKQTADIAKKTFSVALFFPSHVSLNGRGLKTPDYDSGSDSSEERLKPGRR